MIATAVAAVLLAVPVEYHLDFSGWHGRAVTEVEFRLTTADGKLLPFAAEFEPDTTPEDARGAVAGTLTNVGWRVESVGKDGLIIRGSKTSPIRGVTVKGGGWTPVVTWAVVPPKK